MADVIFRGVKFHKNCSECFFGPICPCLTDYDDYSSILDAVSDGNLVRHEECPVFPLPEGHGRLIDADALRKYILSEEEHYGYLDVHDLRNAPTIIEADLEWKMKNCCCFSNNDPGEGGPDK